MSRTRGLGTEWTHLGSERLSGGSPLGRPGSDSEAPGFEHTREAPVFSHALGVCRSADAPGIRRTTICESVHAPARTHPETHMRYFEDFQVGQVLELGSYEVTREEILAFARQYDPQPFHLDEEAGRRSIYGSIIASGWQTAAICHRMLVRSVLEDSASMGSPGVDELRWLRPVRPGDTISARIEVLEVTPSRSKPDRGSIRTRMEVRNQQGEVVMTESAAVLFRRRPA